MTKNLFFASCAKAAFALAAVVMMSTVFTSCSKDNDDDPKPEPKANTVTIDGAERAILKAEYEDKKDGDYILYFYLSDDHKEKVTMQLNKDVHMTGNPVNLTEREKTHDGWYWMGITISPTAISSSILSATPTMLSPSSPPAHSPSAARPTAPLTSD